jgi:Flp pilus assembly protein TadG
MRALLSRLARSTSGVALVEFAIAMPVLFVLYIMSFVISDEISCNRKVTVTARTVADLTSRYASLTQSGLQTLMAASKQVMSPYTGGTTTVRVTELLVTSTTTATVVWSQTQTGSTTTQGLANGSVVTLPTSLAATGTYLIMGEVTYIYQPVIGLGPTAAMTLADKSYMSPRISNAIPLSS